MTDDRSKTPRTLLLADHLWEAFSTMAVEMGSDRDALINQALYTFARLNGFLVPLDLKKLGTAEAGRLRLATAGQPPSPAEDRSPPRPHANPDRMAEIAQKLAGNLPRAISPPVSISEPSPVEVDHSLLGEEGAATAMELPNIASALGGIKQPAPISAAHPSDPGTVTPDGRTLVLLSDGRELDRVVKDRFLIGRGKHCDLIINSGKVSREHAAITREGSDWFIEDLGSSNGTWFDKRRISRRQIQDGDEYYICSEKLSCTFR
jgi:hypothetical protein